MNETALFARVQALLDERRDPFDDECVVAALQAHPEWLERTVGLRADASALSRLPVAPARRSRRWPWLVAAGFVAAAAILVTTVPCQPPRATGGRILVASLEELRPRAHVAATFVVHERLLATPTTRLDTWQTRSEVR